MSALEELPTTDSGSVRKKDALQWMQSLGDADEDDLLAAVEPKPDDHSGSSFPTPYSGIRVTGTPEFITEVARLLQPLLAWESSATRLELKVQQIEDRESGELTDNYALYLSVAERGREGALRELLIGSNSENDKRLLDIFDETGRMA